MDNHTHKFKDMYPCDCFKIKRSNIIPKTHLLSYKINNFSLKIEIILLQ